MSFIYVCFLIPPKHLRNHLIPCYDFQGCKISASLQNSDSCFHHESAHRVAAHFPSFSLIFMLFYDSYVLLAQKLKFYHSSPYASKEWKWRQSFAIICSLPLTCPEAETLRLDLSASWPSADLSPSCLRRSRLPPEPWANDFWAFSTACRSSAPQHCCRFCKSGRCKSLPWLTYLWKPPSHFLHSCLYENKHTRRDIELRGMYLLDKIRIFSLKWNGEQPVLVHIYIVQGSNCYIFSCLKFYSFTMKKIQQLFLLAFQNEQFKLSSNQNFFLQTMIIQLTVFVSSLPFILYPPLVTTIYHFALNSCKNSFSRCLLPVRSCGTYISALNFSHDILMPISIHVVTIAGFYSFLWLNSIWLCRNQVFINKRTCKMFLFINNIKYSLDDHECAVVSSTFKLVCCLICTHTLI